jgi:3-oxoacyl-[acyl-carrier protein] reductase
MAVPTTGPTIFNAEGKGDRVLLKRKRVVVTGGARGIGAGVVRMALQEGADVVFTYRSSVDLAGALARELSDAHPEQLCVALYADVADSDCAVQAAEAAMESLGGVDVLVNNAGIARDSAFARMRRDDWDAVMATNIGSMFNMTQPFVLPMVKQRAGSIVNISSVTGVYGTPGQMSYATSKAGIIGFTKALAKELGSFGVRANAVAPGMIETDMTANIPEQKMEFLLSRIPRHEFGSAGDVADAVCFLASDRARYVTGQVLEVAGGLVL